MHKNNTEVSQKRYRYCGKEKDNESGLYYYGARYYADWLCRFTAVDPRKDQYPFQNSYAYAANNPITFTDVNDEGPNDPEDEKIEANTFHTPNGGIVSLPRGSNVYESDVYKSNVTMSDGNLVSGIKYNSLRSFSYQGETYTAKYSEDDKFLGYFGSNGLSLTPAGSTLPEPTMMNILSTNPTTSWLFSNDTELSTSQASIGMLGASRSPWTAGAVLGVGFASFAVIKMASNGSISIPVSINSTTSLNAEQDLPAIPFTLPGSSTLPVSIPSEDPAVDYFIHYTDNSGLAGILESGAIFPNSQGKVHMTKHTMSPEDVENLIFIGDPLYEGRGENMILFYVTASQRAMIKADKQNIYQYIYQSGSLRIKNQILYSGPNPF